MKLLSDAGLQAGNVQSITRRLGQLTRGEEGPQQAAGSQGHRVHDAHPSEHIVRRGWSRDVPGANGQVCCKLIDEMNSADELRTKVIGAAR